MSDESKQQQWAVAVHTLLPMSLLLFIEMWLNHYFAVPNSIFLSPYLLAFLVANAIGFIVLLKGDICPGQTGRLLFVFKFFLLFALGHFLYSVGFTPKHHPLGLVAFLCCLLPLIYWILPREQPLRNGVLYCGLAATAIGILLYAVVYWLELPSLFNGIRANNFAQILLGIVLAGWLLMLAKSRLDQFFKLLIKVAMLVLVANYLWTLFVLYQQFSRMPEMPIYPYFLYFASQFALLVVLAWLLLGKGEKQMKNPLGWSLALLLAAVYPFANML